MHLLWGFTLGGTTSVQWYELSYCQPGIISWRPSWIYAILDTADRQNSSSIVFPVSENIHVDIKFAFLRYFFRESMIICSAWFNMGRTGIFSFSSLILTMFPNFLGFILLVCHKAHWSKTVEKPSVAICFVKSRTIHVLQATHKQRIARDKVRLWKSGFITWVKSIVMLHSRWSSFRVPDIEHPKPGNFCIYQLTDKISLPSN